MPSGLAKTTSHPHTVVIADSNNYTNVQYHHSCNRGHSSRPRRRPAQAPPSSTHNAPNLTPSDVFSPSPIPSFMSPMTDWNAFSQSITGAAQAQAAAAMANAQQSFPRTHPAYAQWPLQHPAFYYPSPPLRPPAPSPASKSDLSGNAKNNGKRKPNTPSAKPHRCSNKCRHPSSAPMHDSQWSPPHWDHHAASTYADEGISAYATNNTPMSMPEPMIFPSPQPMSAPQVISGVNCIVSNINSGNCKSIVITNARNASGRSGNSKSGTTASQRVRAGTGTGTGTGKRTVHATTTKISHNSSGRSRNNGNVRIHINGEPVQEQVIQENWDSDSDSDSNSDSSTESIGSQEEENEHRSPPHPLPRSQSMPDELGHNQASSPIPNFPPPAYTAIADNTSLRQDNANNTHRTGPDANLDVKADSNGSGSTTNLTIGEPSQSSSIDNLGEAPNGNANPSTESLTSRFGRWLHGSR